MQRSPFKLLLPAYSAAGVITTKKQATQQLRRLMPAAHKSAVVILSTDLEACALSKKVPTALFH